MKFAFKTMLTLALAVALLGCQQNAGTTTSGPSLADELGVRVPTQTEADAAAAQRITSQNADREFDQLQREIESER